MEKNKRRDVEERRVKNRRNNERRRENRGIVDRRGKMERRENFKNNEQNETKNFDDQIEGRNAVIELLESDKDINKIYITKGEQKGSINKIIAMANEKKVIIVEKDKRQMDLMAQTENYQGVIAIVPPFEYSEIEDILELAKIKN